MTVFPRFSPPVSPPVAIIIALLAAVGALTTAYIAQYVYGYAPCELCLWQRKPLWAVVVLAPLLLLAGRKWAKIGLTLLALLYLAAAGIAFFHVGVEHHWWAGTGACTAVADSKDPATLREQLLGTRVARCDQVGWTFLTQSMATWNVPFSLILAFLMIVSLIRYVQNPKPN